MYGQNLWIRLAWVKNEYQHGRINRFLKNKFRIHCDREIVWSVED